MTSDLLGLSSAPYPGLRPFRTDEADIFFGRERQTDQLLDRLATHRFVAVTGPSGCGKSSLVKAGVIPALNAGFMVAAGSRWRIASMRPGEHPIARLARAVATPEVLGEYRASEVGLPLVEAALRRGPLGLVDLLRTSTALHGANLLVLVDQFEELFRYREKTDPEEADAFVALLLASAATPDVPVYVVLTMRSDYLGDCALFPGLAEAVSVAQFLTPRLTREELTSAVVGPARIFGGSVSPQLVNRILNEFGSDPDRLPVLQHALMRMWNRPVPAGAPAAVSLDVDSYEAIGGFERALSQHVDEALAEIEAERAKRIAETMFRRLTERAKGRRDIRAPARAKDVRAIAGATLPELAEVIQVFRRGDRGFVVASDEEPHDDTVLDIGHEALIVQWKTLAGWVEAEAASAAMYRRLVETGHLNRQGRAQLWSEPDLGFALRWRREEAPTREWAARYGSSDDFDVAMEFLAASEAAHQKELAAAEWRRGVQLRRAYAAGAISVLVTLGLVAGILLRGYWYVWEHHAYYRDVVRVWGAPSGVGPLAAAAARHRSSSIELVTKGTRGRVIRMRAVDSRLAPTTRHGIGTYLEYGSGGTDVPVRWEFDYDAEGRRVTHERAYDRRGKHVWTFAYMPVEGAGTTRVGSFLGPDGLPLGRRFVDEGRSHRDERQYSEMLVLVDYDGDGREARTRYRTRGGYPAAGKDRAYGQAYGYESGQLTSMTSLGADDRPVNDVVGNATLRLTYDRDGNLQEAVAEGADGQVVMTSDRWARQRFWSDEYGRRVKTEFYDESSKPVLARDGYHRVENEFDAAGNSVRERYFDASGRPALVEGSGCHGYDAEPDARGNIEKLTCIGVDGSPAPSKWGWTTNVLRYDAQDEVVEESFRDAAGAPALGSAGYSRRVMEYDGAGHRTSSERYGLDGAPVAGREGWKTQNTYDERGNLVRSVFVGTDGRPFIKREGYASYTQEFDRRGNRKRVSYLGPDGRPTLSSEGVAGWEARFDALGQEVEFWYRGLDGGPVLGPDGSAGERKEYEESGQLREVTFTGLSGEPVSTKEGVAGWKSSHDEMGRETSRTYLGTDRRPTTHAHGYASWRARYDRRGNQIRFEYRDIRDHPVVLKPDPARADALSGYAIRDSVYDDRSNVVEERYTGAYGQPVLVGSGFARAVHQYDARGNCVATAYFGLQNEPVLVSGYHAIERDYDALGRVTQVRFLSTTRKPTESTDGFARIDRTYDSFGRMATEAAFAANGAPALTPDGFHRLSKAYDERGGVTGWFYFGLRGEPTTRAGGYHAELKQLDALGRDVQVSYVGIDGKTLVPLTKDKYARMRSRYDALGRVVEVSLFGPDDRPILGSAGWSRLTTEYDERGNVVQATAYGPDGKPARLDRGHWRVRSEYGPHGKVIRRAYYGVDGKPVLVARDEQGEGGFASEKLRYDGYGNLVECAYFGVAGEKVRQYAGYHRSVSKFGARGELLEVATYGVAGSLTVNESGFARFTRRYDDAGRLLEIAAYDASGGLIEALHGYARMVHRWDARGNHVSERYYGSGGGLVIVSGGAAGWDKKFDGRGNEVEIVFVGVSGRPADGDAGYARAVRRYDERRRKIEERYFHADGSPARIMERGQHVTRFTYDLRGDVSEERYLDERGQRCRGYHAGELCSRWTATYDEDHNELRAVCHRVGLEDAVGSRD